MATVKRRFKRPRNITVAEHGLTYRVCVTDDGLNKVLFVARKNKVRGETVLQYGGQRFQHIVLLARKQEATELWWEE